MKKIMLLAAIIILLSGTHAWCASLTCDCTTPTDKVTGFQLQFGTATPIDVPAVECVPAVTDGKRILYDLASLPNGAFTVKAKAVNLWGGSEWTNPLSGTKQLPTSPGSLRITP